MASGIFSFKNRTLLMILGVMVFFAIAWFVIIPTVVAHQYLGQLRADITRARADAKTVSTGQDVIIFQDPDVTLEKRQTLATSTLADIQKTQADLDRLQRTNHTLTPLPGNGFMGMYHTALVRQGRTDNAVRQSRQVLDNYRAVLAYIHACTGAQLYLGQQLRYVNGIRDFGALEGQGSTFAAIAANLRASRQKLAALTPPPDFAPLHTSTLQTLSQAADAFQRLGDGLNRHSDGETYDATAALEQLDDKENVSDKELVTDLALSSPTLAQLSDLPEKFEHVEQ